MIYLLILSNLQIPLIKGVRQESLADLVSCEVLTM